MQGVILGGSLNCLDTSDFRDRIVSGQPATSKSRYWCATIPFTRFCGYFASFLDCILTPKENVPSTRLVKHLLLSRQPYWGYWILRGGFKVLQVRTTLFYLVVGYLDPIEVFPTKLIEGLS